ncbi:hypothetical protein ACFWPH_28230 [Nocardia sp. NPDC058499]|uniref:hypothetical protein n=1 Tax=Nocardia sp. NPDC058499 TaxID=3346530 RepID=UPI00365A1748
MLEIVVAGAVVLTVVGLIFLPVLAQWAGVLLIVDSLLSPLLGGEVGFAVLWLMVGFGVWLLGHLVEAHRNDGYWGSRLAEWVFRLPVLRELRPTW